MSSSEDPFGVFEGKEILCLEIPRIYAMKKLGPCQPAFSHIFFCGIFKDIHWVTKTKTVDWK